ncbi:MAG: SPASM domain-containing protein [Thermodesulfovibrionales bacterium]|nr:SPASM domain-containing protein [Thermodesulfovibrionales bacterium]
MLDTVSGSNLHLFRVRDEHFLYDVEENRIFSLSERAYDIARSMVSGNKRKRGFSLRNIIAEREIQKIIQDIEPLSEDEVEHRKKILEQEDYQLTGLWLGLAHSCNLGCRYCFANSPKYLKTNYLLMSQETAFKGIDFLLNQSPEAEEYDIIFFGGEPLLNLELLKKVIDYTTKSSKRFHYSITTNGTLLNRDVFEYLKENDVSMMISVDGSEEIHNRNRPYKNGRPSWQDIVENIKSIPNVGDYIMARVTITSTTPSLIEIFDTMRGLDFVDITFAEVCPNSGEMPVFPADMIPVWKEQYLDLAEYILKVEPDPYNRGLKCLSVNMQAMRQRKRSFYCCSTGISSLYLSPEGNFYPCMRLISETDEHVMGSLNDGIKKEKVRYFVQNHVFNKTCKDCWARYICGGGCYGDSYAYSGSIWQTIDTYCVMSRYKIEVSAYLLKKLKDRNALPETQGKINKYLKKLTGIFS